MALWPGRRGGRTAPDVEAEKRAAPGTGERRRTWSADEWEKFQKANIAGYLDWYWDTGTSLVRWSKWLRRVGIWAGLLATAAAAFPTDVFGTTSELNDEIRKWVVVVLTALVTSVAASQSRVAQAARAREAGRATVAEIDASLRTAMLFEPMTDGERARRLATLPPLIAAVERQFGGDTNGGGDRTST